MLETRLAKYNDHVSTPVNSATFDAFLWSHPYLNIHIDNFAPYLDLSHYTPLLDYVYNSPDKVGPVLSDDDIATFEADDFRWLSDEDKKKLKEEIGPLEKTTTLFVEQPDGQTIYCSELTYGTHSSAVVHTIELVKQRKRPLIEQHTHPELSLFSPADYVRLLIGDKLSQTRLLRAAMLLCPDDQILALVTSQTPYLDPLAATVWAEDWKKTFNSQYPPFPIYRKKRYHELVEEYTQAHETESGVTLAEVEKAVMLNKQNIISKETLELTCTRLMELNRVKTERLLEIFQTILANLRLEYTQGINAMHLQFAREINIKLYRSTNRRDFYAFSS